MELSEDERAPDENRYGQRTYVQPDLVYRLDTHYYKAVRPHPRPKAHRKLDTTYPHRGCPVLLLAAADGFRNIEISLGRSPASRPRGALISPFSSCLIILQDCALRRFRVTTAGVESPSTTKEVIHPDVLSQLFPETYLAWFNCTKPVTLFYLVSSCRLASIIITS